MVTGTSYSSSARSLNRNEKEEKEFLTFETFTEGIPEETALLVQHIKEVAESLLFHWKSFPIVLPTPLAVYHETPSTAFYGGSDVVSQRGDEGGDSEVRDKEVSLLSGRVRPLTLREVFITPSFDELDAVAVDSKGDPQKLSPNHLESIRDKGAHQDNHGKRRRLNEYQLEMLRNSGEFEVQSLHFPGQTHRWRVSGCLQKGNERTREAFLDDLAKAASLVIVTGVNRINGPFFSMKKAISSLCNGVLTLVDLIVGIQWVEAHNLEDRIKEERYTYLVQELTAKDGDVEGLCSWILQQVKRASKEKFRLCSNKQPFVPYLFSTPQAQELNLKLFNRDLMKKIIPVIVGILEKESRGWFLHFREKTIFELKSRGLSDQEVQREGNRLVQEEYLKKVFEAISSNQTLIDMGSDIPKLLIDQARAVLLMHQSIDEVERIYADGEKSCKEELKHTHPILCRISSWLESHLAATHETLGEQHKWRPHEHALALCKQEGLCQHAYFLQRDLSFMREREPVLSNELKNVKVATRIFQWRAQIWFPGKYVVHRSFQGETEVIPTILAMAPTSITTPRSDPNQPVYLLEKQMTRTTSTRWPLWRWFNVFHRSWAWTFNALFFFAVWLPFCSPISLRALFSQDPFMPDFELSQVNGTVCPSKASLTLTLAARLTNLWRHISKSRTHFETMPDTGFIGKGVSRHMNRLWNYLLKGIVGTLFLTAVFPLVCIILSLGSLVIALTSPLWCPASVVVFHILFILVYDFDSPTGDNQWFPLIRIVLWDFICLGLVQPVLALSFAFFVCPLLAFFVVLFALSRRGFRHIWDKLMFHCVIKKRGRVPASDSILVKRIAGPGLHDNFVYQISCEQALASFEARLEMDQLATFEKDKEELISEPLVVYGEFVQRAFGPFSGVLGRWGNFGRVEKEVRDLNNCLYEKVERRRRELSLSLPVSVRSKIKMRTSDLKTVLKRAIIILEEFYPTKILNKIVRSPSIGDSISESSGSVIPSRNSELLEEINSLLHQGLMERVLPNQDRKSPREKYETVEAWWDSRGLPIGDYAGLTSLIFTEIFSPDFLTPLEDTDTIFPMEIQGLSLSRYTEMIRTMDERKDLDDKITVHTPRGNIKIHSPFLELSSFTPLVRHSVPTHKTEKASLAARLSLRLNPGARLATGSHLKVPEKLLIPPPVPHPAYISIIIHNRDAFEPITLEDSLTKQVLRTIEESTHAVSSGSNLTTEEETSDGTSSCSASQVSEYDDPSMYQRASESRNGTKERHKRRSLSATGRSRMATLEMTDTLEKGRSIDSRTSRRRATVDEAKSNTLESLPRRSSGWLTSPLRALLEGQRPFSVALNLAAAEDDNPTPEDEEDFSPLSFTHPIPQESTSSNTTSV